MGLVGIGSWIDGWADQTVQESGRAGANLHADEAIVMRAWGQENDCPLRGDQSRHQRRERWVDTPGDILLEVGIGRTGSQQDPAGTLLFRKQERADVGGSGG